MATDALSWVTSKLDAETVKSILDGVTMGKTKRADAQDPVVAEADEEIHKPIQKTAILATAAQAHVNLHVTDWVTAQQEDPILKTVIEWISRQKVQDLKHLLGSNANTEEEKTVLWEWKKLMLYHGALYHCHTPKGKLEEVLWFVVPPVHQVTAMNGCHWDGHQGQQQTMCLLHHQFWWPGMGVKMQKVTSCCEQCIQQEGNHAKAPMWPIIVTAALELLHIDLTRIETTMELDQPPNVVNLLVFCNHFTKHVMAYVTLTKLWKLLLSFCGKDISWSSEHWPSSRLTKEPPLKATSSESFASLWAYGRLVHNLIMFKAMDRWNKLTKCWCAW